MGKAFEWMDPYVFYIIQSEFLCPEQNYIYISFCLEVYDEKVISNDCGEMRCLILNNNLT